MEMSLFVWLIVAVAIMWVAVALLIIAETICMIKKDKAAKRGEVRPTDGACLLARHIA